MNTQQNKTFERVEIRSEEDLPEKGKYIVRWKTTNIVQEFDYYDMPRDKNVWLKDIDWYLKPLSPSPVTKEKIIAKLQHWGVSNENIAGMDEQGNIKVFKSHELIAESIASELSLSERKMTDEEDYKTKYEKCIDVIKRVDPGIIGMCDLW